MKNVMFRKDSINAFIDTISQAIEQKLSIYMIGGGAMCLKKLKESTLDIDLIVLTHEDFQKLKKAMLKAGFKVADKELFREAVYRNAVIVFQKGPSRIDIFIRRIAGMMDFSERMIKRAELYTSKGLLSVYLTSNTDIFLLKSLSDREKDFADIDRLLQEEIRLHDIFIECDRQNREGVKWIFFVYEQLCRVENALQIQIEIKDKVFAKCRQYWKDRPGDFMVDIDNIDRHIPALYRQELLRSLNKRRKAA